MDTAQSLYDVKPNFKGLFHTCSDFCMTPPFMNYILWRTPYLDSLSVFLQIPICEERFLLDMQYCRKLTELISCNRILTVIDGLGYIGIFSVNPPKVKTISASRLALYFCWSSFLPEYFYHFLIFSRHLCSYISLLLHYWSTPMVTMCFSSCYESNNPLRKARFY